MSEIIFNKEREAAQLWQSFARGRKEADRDRLLSFYARHTSMITKSMFLRFNASGMSFDDFSQYAQLGMLEAIERYDIEKGAAFKTFSTYRIKGAIYTGIKQHSEKTDFYQHQRKLEKEREAALVKKANQDDGDPMDKALGLIFDLVLSHLMEPDDEEASDEEESYSTALLDDIGYRTVRKQLLSLVEHLGPIENKVIMYHYFYEFSYDEISKTLNLSKSRIAQIHGKGMSNLRELYKAKGMLDITL